MYFDTHAVHSIESAGEDDILVNILMRREFFDTAFLSRMTVQGIVSEFLVDAVTESRKKEHYLYFPSHKNPQVHELMKNIMVEYFSQDIGTAEVLESYINILFTELLRTLRDESTQKDDLSREVQIVELLSYIEKKLRNLYAYTNGESVWNAWKLSDCSSEKKKPEGAL